MAEELNAFQIKLVCAVLTSLEGQIKVDWEQVYTITGHANAASARRRWDELRAKKGWAGGSAGKGKDVDHESASKPKATRKRKNAGSKDEFQDDADGAGSPSIAKKARKNAKSGKEIVKSEPVEA